VLLHGFGSRGAHWLPNILPHAGRYRFFLPDLRGFGGSHHASLDGRDVFSTYACDLQEVLDHFELDKVILGGISTGAFTCLVYNHDHGFSRVSRYLNIEHGPDSRSSETLAGIFSHRQAEIFARFRQLLVLAQAAGHGTAYWDLPAEVRVQFRDTTSALFRRALNQPGSRLVVTLMARLMERALTKYFMPVEKWWTYLHVMSAFMEGKDTRPALAGITIPTTLMMGRHSRFFSVESQMEIARHVPHARVVIFEKSGHIPILDEPLHFQRQFSAFLAQE